MIDHWEDNNIEKPRQFVVCAACKYGDVIIAGARHYDSVMHSQLKAFPEKGEVRMMNRGLVIQGFINQFGEFLSREEAIKIVLGNDQPIDLTRNGHQDRELYSEALY